MALNRSAAAVYRALLIVNHSRLLFWLRSLRQGITQKDEMSDILRVIRSGYAKYQLGANPKVWVTQLSSVFASSSMLEYKSIAKGFSLDNKLISDVDNYCMLAKIRNTDNVAAISQGVLDNNKKVGKAVNSALEKTEKLSDSLMKPIGKVDRFVIERLFGACQVEIENKKGFKIGTEENKIEAGNLLTRVILETQQNSMVTERSAAMRSSSEILKTLTMFSADGMKVIGRVGIASSFLRYASHASAVCMERNLSNFLVM